MTKTCSRCRTEKSIDAFSCSRRSRDGRQGYCRDCSHAYIMRRNEEKRPVRATEEDYFQSPVYLTRRMTFEQFRALQSVKPVIDEYLGILTAQRALQALDEAFGRDSFPGRPARVLSCRPTIDEYDADCEFYHPLYEDTAVAGQLRRNLGEWDGRGWKVTRRGKRRVRVDY